MRSKTLTLFTAMILWVALALSVQLSAQTITTIDPPGSILTQPSSINQAGAITGFYQDAGFNTHGFLRDAKGSFTSFDAPGSISTQPNSINQPGAITGFYLDNVSSNTHGFLRDAKGTIITIGATPTSTY